MKALPFTPTLSNSAVNPVPVLRVQLMREGTVQSPRTIRNPAEVAALFHEFLAHADREYFLILLLDTKSHNIGIHVVSIGTLNSALVSPREVFKAAILANAASVVLGHNHPSGNFEPSPEDIQLTKRLVESGEILDIPVWDHIIVGPRPGFCSLSDLGHIPTTNRHVGITSQPSKVASKRKRGKP